MARGLQRRKKLTSEELGFPNEDMSLVKLAKIAGVSRQRIHQKYQKGYRGEELLKRHAQPRAKKQRDDFLFGDYLSVQQMAKAAGVATSTIYARYKNGFRNEGLINPVRLKRGRRKNEQKQM